MKLISKRVAACAASLALVASAALVGCSGQPAADQGAGSSSASGAAGGVQLQIFAANSLSKAMEEVQAIYTEQTGVTFADTQYEGSGTLNEMLGGGAYADALITASNSTMDTAVDEGYVDAETRFPLFTNDLVIVSGLDSTLEDVTLEDIASGAYTLAVGDASVPRARRGPSKALPWRARSLKAPAWAMYAAMRTQGMWIWPWCTAPMCIGSAT